jgi:hypothetical protein
MTASVHSRYKAMNLSIKVSNNGAVIIIGRLYHDSL